MSGSASSPIADCMGGVTIRVYVAPRSSANSVVGLHNGEVKITLTSPPIDGAANKALLEFISRQLGVPKGAVSLISGETSRHKIMRIDGVGAVEVEKRLIPRD